MIRALCIDDEQAVLNVVYTLITRHVPQITELDKALGPLEGLAKIKSFKPHLVFLDIDMPVMNGFEMLEAVEEKNFDVIFVTAFNQFAIRAFKFSAVDYLLKPLDIEELQQSVQRHVERLHMKTSNIDTLNVLTHNLHHAQQELKISIMAPNGMHFVAAKDILRCEADGNYTHIYTMDKKHFLSTRTLAEYDDMLNEHNFLRVHRSHLVNRNFILRITPDNQLELKDQTLIGIARRRAAEIKDILR